MSEHAREEVVFDHGDRVGVDAISVKPTEITLDRSLRLPVGSMVVDWEGREHLPEPDLLRRLAADADVRVTVPVRADGFDPLGDDTQFETIPDGIEFAFVAGHPAYLSPEERRRSVAPRFGAALDRYPDAWVGTEGVTEVALATGATQFDLLAAGTERRIRALRSAGFRGDIAIYAPTVLSDDPDAVLDAVGAYVARRGPVAERLPGECATDATASGTERDILLEAADEYALVGDAATVQTQITGLREAGADYVVAYPARGVEGRLMTHRPAVDGTAQESRDDR